MSDSAAKHKKEGSQTPGPKFWHGMGTGARVTVAVITLVAAAITIWQVWPSDGPGITFTNPSPNAITPVGCVLTVSGRGSPPTGQALVISNQQQGTDSNVDSTDYFAAATISGNTWQAVSQVGGNSTPPGTPFTLTAWLVNAGWIKYLSQVNSHPLWWGTLDTPPGAVKIQAMTVTRMAGKCS